MAVLQAVHNKEKPLPYQTKLVLAELFDTPGLIEPTLDGQFMSRISQAATQGGQAEKAQGGPARPRPMAGSIAQSMKSPLDSLHV